MFRGKSTAHRRGFNFTACRSEGIEGRQDTAFCVWHTCESKAHFNSAESSGQHQIVEAAEVSYPEYFAREFREAGSQGHIKILEDDCPQFVRVVTFGHEDRRQ